MIRACCGFSPRGQSGLLEQANREKLMLESGAYRQYFTLNAYAVKSAMSDGLGCPYAQSKPRDQ